MKRPPIRLADPGDLAEILELLDEAAVWLRDRGITDQWRAGEFPAQKIVHDIASGNVHVMRLKERMIAAVTIDGFADPDFWEPADDPQNALYVHRLVVHRTCAGQGIGSYLLDFADRRAGHLRRAYTRVDCAKWNHSLHDYYKKQGFDHVRTVDLPHRRSGALFQRPTVCSFDDSRMPFSASAIQGCG